MPKEIEKIENLGKDPWENYWRHIRLKAVEFALREAEIFKTPPESFDLVKRANEIFSYLNLTGPED
jgi:hypothetical protein